MSEPRPSLEVFAALALPLNATRVIRRSVMETCHVNVASMLNGIILSYDCLTYVVINIYHIMYNNFLGTTSILWGSDDRFHFVSKKNKNKKHNGGDPDTNMCVQVPMCVCVPICVQILIWCTLYKLLEKWTHGFVSGGAPDKLRIRPRNWAAQYSA